MKRKLSLLMVLMMVLSMVPVMPSFANSGDINSVNIANDLKVGDFTGGDVNGNGIIDSGDAINKTMAPRVVFDNAQLTVGSNDTRPISTKTMFSIVIENSNNAKFITESYNTSAAGDSTGVTVKAISSYVLEVEVDPGIAVTSGTNNEYQNFVVPMFIQSIGYGDVKVRFDERLKGFKDSNKKPLIATIHKTGNTAIVDKVGNIARNNHIVETTTANGRVRIVETTSTSWKGAEDKKIELRLDSSDYEFYNIKGAVSLTDVGTAVDYYRNGTEVDRRTVVVNLEQLAAMSKYSTTSRNELVLDLPIRVSRDAKVGTEVTVSLSGEVSPTSLVIAKYTDYAIELKTEKVLDVIAGQDIQNKYVAKVTLEEMVPGSLLDGRVVEVALRGTKKDKDGKESVKEDVAAYQYDSTVKIERLKGTGDVNIVKSDLSTVSGTGKSVRVNKNKDGIQLFELEVNRGSNLPDNNWTGSKPYNTADKWELTIPFVVSTDYVGDLNLQIKGAGIPAQSVKIATVKAPVTFEVAKTDGGKLADLVIGKQHQEAPDVTIKETEAGTLQVKDIIRGEKNWYGFYGTDSKKSDLVLWGGAVVTGEFTKKDGDAKIDDTTRQKDTGNLFMLKEKSSKAATFKAEGVKVTLDRTVPYGPYKIDIDAGNVEARHKDLTDIIASPEYFNVVTPYPEDKNVKTVFTIGDQKYVQTISGKDTEVVMDAAAQISNDRTVLPMRYVADAIGAKVVYDPATRVATFTKDATVVSLNIDADSMYVNGSIVKLDSKPMNVNGRILVSVTNIAQAFGMSSGTVADGINNDIEWDAAAKTVTLFATKK